MRANVVLLLLDRIAAVSFFLFVDGTFRWGTAFVEGRRGRELVFVLRLKLIKN